MRRELALALEERIKRMRNVIYPGILGNGVGEMEFISERYQLLTRTEFNFWMRRNGGVSGGK